MKESKTTPTPKSKHKSKNKNKLFVLGSFAVVAAIVIWAYVSVTSYNPSATSSSSSTSSTSQVSDASSNAGSSDTSAASSQESSDTASSDSQDPASVPAGTTATTDNGDGTQTATFGGAATYTITSAEWTDERDAYATTSPSRVLKVTYNVTNLSGQEITIGTDMDLYAGDSKQSTYGSDSTYDVLAAGGTYEGAVQYFAVDASGNLSLQILPLVDLSQDPATVNLNVSN